MVPHPPLHTAVYIQLFPSVKVVITLIWELVSASNQDDGRKWCWYSLQRHLFRISVHYEISDLTAQVIGECQFISQQINAKV